MCSCFFILVVRSIMSLPNGVDCATNSYHDGWPRTAVAAERADYQSSLEAPADQIKYETLTTHKSVRSPSASPAETCHYSRIAALRRRLRDR